MTQIPAGWYPDPAQTHPGRQRYWDGAGWTGHVHDPQPPAPPAPTVPAVPQYPQGYQQPQREPQYQPQYEAQHEAQHEAQYQPQPQYQYPQYQYPQYQNPQYQYPQGYAQPYGQPAYPAVAQPRTTPDGQPLSGWWRRVLAQVVDGLILSPVYLGILAAFIASRWDEIRAWWDDYTQAVDAGTTLPSPPDLFQPYSAQMFGLAAAYTVVLAVYTLGFWRWKQATPGKLLVGVRIRRREAPGPMPWATMLPRFAFVQGLALAAYVPWVGFLFALAGLLDYLWPLWDGNKQALHDKVARTNVVLAPPRADQPSTTELSAAGMPPRW